MTHQEVQNVLVPEAPVYTVPACRVCGAQFEYWRGAGTPHETWKQTCSCEGSSSTLSSGPGYKHHDASFQGHLIGQPKPYYCMLCREPMQTGEPAKFGPVGPPGYGYAHSTMSRRYNDAHIFKNR